MSRYIAVDIGGTRMSAACYGNEVLDPIQLARITAQAPELKEHTMNPNYLDNLTLTHAAFGYEIGLVGAPALGRTRYPPTAHKHE